MSQTRTDLFNALQTRLQTLGHVFPPATIYTLCSDIERVIVNDQATVIADATADIAAWPQAPQTLET